MLGEECFCVIIKYLKFKILFLGYGNNGKEIIIEDINMIMK